MKKLFWNNLVKIEEIEVKIDQYDLKEEEKSKLLKIVHQTFYIRVLETILLSLPEEKHKTFLDRFSQEPHHPKLLDFLKKEAGNIEEKIVNLGKKLKKEILEELNKI